MRFKYLGEILGCKNYGAISGKYSFTISYFPNFGWSASWKDREFEGPQSSRFILNGGQRSVENPFKTRDQAEAACRHQRKKLSLS
jgi:hypothetical protein